MQRSNPTPARGLLARLRRAVPDGVVTDPALIAAHTTDYTGRYVGHSDLLIRPRAASQVSAALQALAGAGRPVVIQGGNTGLVGGSVPVDGEAVLSTAGLDHLGPVDVAARQVTAGAGVTLQAVDEAARTHGLRLGVQIASRGVATVGGAVATNAGGTRVLRHGPMRDQVAGLSAVLGDGTVLSHLAGLDKDNTGLRWDRLLCGSEGTLGAVTAARLRLVPVADHATVALAGLADVAELLELLEHLRARVGTLESAELMLAEGIDLVCGQLGLPEPLDRRYPAYLLVEAADTSDPTEQLAAAFADAPVAPGAVAVATDAAARRRLWSYRERHTEAIGRVAQPVKCDVSVPAAAYAHFAGAVSATVAELGSRLDASLSVVRFGHVADGNLHVNVLGVPDHVDAAGAVFSLVASLDGSVSAEHGIGRLKAPYLGLNRSAAERELFDRLRAAADPAGICNPNIWR